MAQVVIASRLTDGRVVFLKEAGDAGEAEWVGVLEAADVAESEDRAAVLLAIGEASAEAHAVVDPYLVDVERKGDGWRPTKYREAIRALGPTIRTDLGKQTEGPEA
jgi:hypothetical protein